MTVRSGEAKGRGASQCTGGSPLDDTARHDDLFWEGAAVGGTKKWILETAVQAVRMFFSQCSLAAGKSVRSILGFIFFKCKFFGTTLRNQKSCRHTPSLKCLDDIAKSLKLQQSTIGSFCMEPCNQSLCCISLFFCDPHPVVELGNHLDKAWQRKQHELRCGCFPYPIVTGLPKSPATPADPSVCPMIDLVAASTNGFSSIRPLPKVLFLRFLFNVTNRDSCVLSRLHTDIGCALRCFPL